MRKRIMEIFCEGMMLERTLYHGTVIDHKKDIEELGLIPMVGDWVKRSYGTDIDFEDDDMFVNDDRFDDADSYYSVVFAADKNGIESALGGIRYHVGRKVGKGINEVSWLDIKNHGMLVIIDDEDGYERFVKHPRELSHDYDSEHRPPPQVEPDDYWTREHIGPSSIRRILVGSALIRYLNKFGLVRKWGGGDRETIERKRSYLIRLVKKHHTDKGIDEIVSKVGSMSDEKIDEWIEKYQGYVGEIDEYK
jgi:hypothetical protein